MLTVTKKQPVVNLMCQMEHSFGFISSMDLAKSPYIVFGKGWAIERNLKNSGGDWTKPVYHIECRPIRLFTAS